MADNSQKTAFHAGEAKGKAEEKTNTLMEKAGGAAQSAKETAVKAGEQVKNTAAGACDAVKNATGMK